MHLNLHEGVPDDTFYIQQSFKDNPTYLTTRAKGKFYQGILVDSLVIYNNRGQVMEKGFFRSLYSYNGDKHPDRLDTINGYGKYGLIGFRHGKFTYYKSGKNYTNYKIDAEIEYAHGFLQGKNIRFHPDGTIHTSDTYFRDTLHGEHLIKYSDGITEEIGYYKMGKKDSLWMNFHPNGKLKDSCFFKENELHSDEKGYYENGQLHYIVPRKDGKLNGTSVYYFSDGKMKSKTNFVNDQLVGQTTSWYHNGQIELKTYYQDGKYTGEYDYYDSLGNTKYLGPGQTGVLMPDYITLKSKFVPPVFYYANSNLNIQGTTMKNKYWNMFLKAKNTIFECEIKDKKVANVSIKEDHSALSTRKKHKLLLYLQENITTYGIFYNKSTYDGTVTFEIKFSSDHSR